MTQNNLNNNRVNSDEVSLKELLLSVRDWFKYICSHWTIILLFGVFGGVVGFLYANYKKPLYTSATTFVLEEEKSSGGVGGLAGLASIAGVDLGSGGGGIFQGDNILELYKSRNMIQKALLTKVEFNNEKYLLVDYYINFSGLRHSWEKKENLKNFSFPLSQDSINKHKFTRLQDSILGSITKVINDNYLSVAKIDKKLSIIKAQVVSSNEFFAKSFNEQIVKTVNDFYIQTKTKKSTANVRILQQKVDSVRAVMNGEIYTAASVADATPNLNPTKQLQRTAPMQRSQFSAETNKMILGELVKNLELSKIALRKETPLIQVIDEPILPLSVKVLGKVFATIVSGALFAILVIGFMTIKMVIKNIID